MPRQKFCSVPGCLSTTDLIKREQQLFLSAHCTRCSVQRPCRCPAPDIYTTRRETRTKFASWCSAIGLKSPGYYINVCYKHFSTGCPSRACPNPDVVQPAWEKHLREKKSDERKLTDLKMKKVRLKNSKLQTSPKTVTTSLLRDALMLPKLPLPKASVTMNCTTASRGMVPTTLIVRTLIPTTIALPQTPIPLNQLTSMASMSNLQCSVVAAPLTPPNSHSSSSSVKARDDILTEVKEEADLNDIMLLGVVKSEDCSSLLREDSSLPLLLDQSEDPYLNEGGLSSALFASDELDSTVLKWMEACEANLLLPI